jgi:hypothetical protein
MGPDKPVLKNRVTLHVSADAAAKIQRLCVTHNSSTKEVVDAALEALELRSLPAHTLLPLDTVRAVEQLSANALRLTTLLARVEVLVLMARRGQLEAAERLIAEAQRSLSTPSPHV